MDDTIAKIGELLSDEESVKQLSELAQMFMSGGSESGESEEKEDKSGSDGGLGFDFSKLMKLQDIMGAVSGTDKNTELLLALKPHLTESKQERVDKAVKIMKLMAIWNVLKDSGMLNDIL